jgi:tetratricopeptide (TPR) repeat protein
MPGTWSRFGGWVAGLALALAGAAPEADEAKAAAAWDAADTALANRYIQGLVENPEYGRLLELLWKHYEDHGQTRVLLNYFEEAARPEDALAAKLIHGHLLRRKGNADQALAQYEAVRARAPEHPAVLTALRDLFRAEGRNEEAREQAADLMGVLPSGADAWAEAGGVLAELHRAVGAEDEAVAVWMELWRRRPEDAALRRRVLDGLVEAGRTAEAVEVCRAEVGRAGGEARLEALRELGTLLEVREEAGEAIRIYEEALSGLHFRHFEADGFLTRLVRAHERFGGLPGLAARWKEAADGAAADEAGLWRMVRFSQLTADAREEEAWLRRLVARVPSDVAYRQRLAEVCFRNGNLSEAARIADALAAQVKPVPVDLVFLQAEIALREAGPEAAARPVAAYLDQGQVPPEILRRILRFAETHSLDGITERLLRDQESGGWGDEGDPVAVKLAAFHRERGNREAALEVMRDHVATAADATERARRTADAVRVLIDLRMRAEALELAEEAVAAGDGSRPLFLWIGELRGGDETSEAAVAALEEAWRRSTGWAEQREVDERLFSLLRARAGEGEGAEPKEEGEIWAELWGYYRKVRALAAGREVTDGQRLRAAWWAVRIGDTDEAYRILPLLHDPDQPVLEHEELLLELAERTGNRALVIRQLELIARIRPEREEEALIRKAEMRLALNFEDEAIRTLRTIVARPGATLKAVQALARAYRQQGRHRALEELWKGAFARANLLERREILGPYAETLVHLEQIPEALSLYREMIGSETDASQRRKWMEEQLSLAERHGMVERWMLPGYEDWAGQRPLDPFGPEALGRVFRSLGRGAEAFAALKRAYYLSGGSEELLPSLAEAASAAGDAEAAIYYQRQLLTRPGAGGSPESWLGLIARMEDALDLEGADRLRRELETRFGQDAEFLRRLAKFHGDRGSAEDALRVWRQVTSLRPWDAAAWFESGLLERSLGQREAAGRSFEAVLRNTAGALAGDGFPLVTVSGRAESADPAGSAAAVIAKFPLLEDPERREISDWVAKPRGAFRRVPDDAAGLRLRAIEELAGLVGSTPGWETRWGTASSEDDPVVRQDRLWAAVHAGPSAWAAQVVEAETRPPSGEGSLGRFRYGLLSLRTGNDERLTRWVAQDPSGLRRRHLLLGVDLLLREGGGALSPERLRGVLRDGKIRVEEARPVMDGLRQDGFAREALWLGEAMAETAAGRGDFLFFQDLADAAGWVGDETGRSRWLREAVAGLDFGRRVEGAIPYLAMYRLVRDAVRLPGAEPGGTEIRDLAFLKLCEATSWSERESVEARLWMLLAVGETDRALEELDRLSEVCPGRRLPGDFLDRLVQVRDRVPGREAWRGWSERVLREVLRNPRPADRAEVLVWSLEALDRARRSEVVREFLAMNPEPTALRGLAEALERRGLPGESVALHAAMLEADGRSPEIWRRFLAACGAARAWEEALAVLDAQEAGFLPLPRGVTAADLHRHRATFLGMAGAVDELSRRAGLEGPGDRMPAPDGTEEMRHLYRRTLAEVHLDEGNPEAAARCLVPVLPDPVKEDRVRWALLLLELGRGDEGQRALEGIGLGPGVPGTEALVEALAEFHAGRGEAGREPLRELARQAVQWSLPVERCGELAERLARAGRAEEADALLALRERDDVDSADRAALRRRRVSWRHERFGESLPLPPALLVGWARSLPEDPQAGRAVVELALKAPVARRAAWAEAANLLSGEERTRLLAALLRLAQGDAALQVAEEVDRLADAQPSWLLRVAAAVMADQGRAAASRAVRWLGEVRSRREGDPLEDAALTLSVLAAAGDEFGIREWRARTAAFPGPDARFVAHALAFREIGRAEVSLGLLEERYRAGWVRTGEDLPFLTAYARELLAARRWPEARAVVFRARELAPGAEESLALVAEWCRVVPGNLETELERFGLRQWERDRVLGAWAGRTFGARDQNGAPEPPTRHSSSKSLGSSLRNREGR